MPLPSYHTFPPCSAKVIGALESQSSSSMLTQRNNGQTDNEEGGEDEMGEDSLMRSGGTNKHESITHKLQEHLHTKNFKPRKGPMLGAPNPDAYEHSAGVAMKRHTRSAEKVMVMHTPSITVTLPRIVTVMYLCDILSRYMLSISPPSQPLPSYLVTPMTPS